LAQYCLINEISARHIPKSLSFEEAVAISINYPTNYLGLVDKGKLERGKQFITNS
jgi:NADPH2:quinone reductase